MVSVFISHSHKDRIIALKLHDILSQNQVEVFLDQEEIIAGDDLPIKLMEGIDHCSKFLILWSKHTQKSNWVRKEWEYAFKSMKRIIPYLIGNITTSDLPDALANYVCITDEDQEYGHSELLKAILGKIPENVRGVSFYEGNWKAKVEAFDGSGTAIYQLNLRSNGQVLGTVETEYSGPTKIAIEMARSQGIDLSHLLKKHPVEGKWSLKPGTISLDLTVRAFGKSSQYKLEIHQSNDDENVFIGIWPGGARFEFWRIS